MNNPSLVNWLWRLCLICWIWALSACNAIGQANSDMDGVGLTGVDHLPEHLSVQDFHVNGYWGAQAGTGARLVCCVIVPRTWRPGLKAHVTWNVTNWKERTSEEHEAEVPIDRYDEVGRMFVHFLANGQVRITLSNEMPWGPTYAGTHEPIPNKKPWDRYPWPSESELPSVFKKPK